MSTLKSVIYFKFIKQLEKCQLHFSLLQAVSLKCVVKLENFIK